MYFWNYAEHHSNMTFPIPKRKWMVFIATILDEYIAAPDGNIDFLNDIQKAGEDYGCSECK